MVNAHKVIDSIINIRDKYLNINTNMLLNNIIFQNIKKEDFLRRIYYNFQIKKAKKSEFLISIGNEPESLYFLKSGEYKLYLHESPGKINELIRFFKGWSNYDFDYEDDLINGI